MREQKPHRDGRAPYWLVVFLCGAILCSTMARAQEPPLPPPSPDSSDAAATMTTELTPEAVQVRLKRAEENKELDPAVKAKVIDDLTNTLELVRLADEAKAHSAQHAKSVGEVPTALETVRADLAMPPPEQPVTMPPDATFAQVQQALSQAENGLSDAEKALVTLQDEPKRRADRRLEIPKLIDAAKLQLQEIDRQLELRPSPADSVEATAAARLLLEARKKALLAEIDADNAELQLFEATGELVSARRDRAVRRAAEAAARVAALRTLVNERRRQEAERQTAEALMTSAQAHPAVRTIAETNGALAQKRQALADKIEITTVEVELLERQLAALDVQFKKTTKRFETAGGTEAIGLLLRKQRDELPDTDLYRRRIRQQSVEVSEAYLELIDYEEKRHELAALAQRVNEVLEGLVPAVTEPERKVLEIEVRKALEARRDVYDSLIADTNSYLESVVELDSRERQLVAMADAFAKYCDERILWIRSATVFDFANVRQLGPSLSWLFDADGWKELAAVVWSDARAHPVLTVPIWLLFALLVMLHPRLRKETTRLGEQAARSSTISYLPTFRAVITTGVMAMTWAGPLGFLGYRLVAAESGSEFVVAWGKGLQTAALLFGTLAFLRQLCRKDGLAEAHFHWDKDTLRAVRNAVRWFMVCGLPAALVVVVTESQHAEMIKNSLGRAAFVTALAALTYCMHRIMRPAGGAFDQVYAAAPQAWYTRLRSTWHVLALAVPAALAVLAAAGYYFTALELSWRLLATGWVVIGLLVTYAALLRWSLLSYRELAMLKAKERRAAGEAATAAGVGHTTSPAVANIQPEMKLSDINKQTRKALQLALGVGLAAGVGLIWIDILPALESLGNLELWTVETVGIDEADGSDGPAATVLKTITLGNVLLAVVTASLTIAAGRSLPSLLEIAVLRRLPLEAGVRYAITTVSQYAITAIGLITAFGVIGIGWSKVQWLVAAISVGLGFGLQEIFANFISGLILLFERPVRLGDIVTVGDVTGHVTRIQMRATTITDWDLRELVVPNKEFITGRLMNWTLSSTASRMSISVGVAYGTDPDTTRNLLLAIATRHPLVLKDPAPHALFDEFSDSTLKFTLRVYMASRDVFLLLRHQLLTEINREFNQVGIKIAFPQRDVHVYPATNEPSQEEAATGSRNGAWSN